VQYLKAPLHDVPAFMSHSIITYCCSYRPSCIGIHLASMSRPPWCPDILSKLSNNSSVICSRCMYEFCHACQVSHHTHMTSVSSASCADNNLDLIHCDMWTSSIISISSYKYYQIIIDDRSHFMLTFHLDMNFARNKICLKSRCPCMSEWMLALSVC
jgi:hypothetical protein